jgi:hypothetical protein
MQAGEIESKTTVSEPTPVENDGSLGPFRHQAFAVLWIATVVANVGTWMQSAAAGWFMTSLDPNPFAVSMVQVAASADVSVRHTGGSAWRCRRPP